MSEVIEELEFNKNNFYRDSYRRIVRYLIFMSMLTLVLTTILAYMNFRPKQPNYYATTTNGEVIPMHSLSEPVVTNTYILQWASLATRNVFNLDFVHYQDQLQKVNSYFTPGGWKQFNMALQESGLLKTVQDKHLDMSAVVSGAPIILNSAVIHGRYTWRIQLPMLITFTSASETSVMRLLVTVNIQRVSVLSAEKGIQISDFETHGV